MPVRRGKAWKRQESETEIARMNGGGAWLHPRAKDFNRKGRKGDAKVAEKSFLFMVGLCELCAASATSAVKGFFTHPAGTALRRAHSSSSNLQNRHVSSRKSKFPP